ncbi:MAG: hypothetical protein AAGJ96_04470 [Pseudomonadota bacterium]
MRLPWLILLCVVGAEAAAEPAPGDIVSQCLSCHMVGPDQIDIIGLSALEALPEEWPFLFEDAFDLDGDGIAGRMRFVSGSERPLVGLFGSALSAGRFEDFAAIAAGAHGLVINGPGEMAQIRAAFEALSPDPGLPFCSAAAQAAFEARGCADCHVTRSFEHNGRHYMPLSDFLLHDLGDGPRRTTPLWGCPDCVTAAGHDVAVAGD